MYHQSSFTADGATFRSYGPLSRFDHHRAPFLAPALDPDRSILYVGADLITSACEVFGELMEAPLCSKYRVSVVEPVAPLTVFDLAAEGVAMSIKALPALADGDEKRELTQEWARAIYEDRPAGKVDGIRYRSAYNSGLSLALWDLLGGVRISSTRKGPADLPLRDSRVFRRLQIGLAARHIQVALVDDNACTDCTKDASAIEPSIKGH